MPLRKLLILEFFRTLPKASLETVNTKVIENIHTYIHFLGKKERCWMSGIAGKRRWGEWQFIHDHSDMIRLFDADKKSSHTNKILIEKILKKKKIKNQVKRKSSLNKLFIFCNFFFFFLHILCKLQYNGKMKLLITEQLFWR